MAREIERNTELVRKINELLDTLEFNSDEPVMVLKIADGREVVIIRSNSFTISRIYTKGRPDGKRPHGRVSYFAYFKEQLEDYRESYDTDEGFSLTPEDWHLLFDEASDRYVRYLLFSEIKRWKDVERDTQTNLDVCDFAKNYAPDDIAWSIYQYKGYIIMMNTIAKTEISLKNNQPEEALENIDYGISQIGKFCAECLREEQAESENITRERYLANLIELRNDIQTANESVERRISERRQLDFEELMEELEIFSEE